jgi:TonB family protein
MSAALRFRCVAAIGIVLLPLVGLASESDLPSSLYLPGITVSASTSEVIPPGQPPTRLLTRCDILLWITADGFVRVAQVIKSTGYARLDEVCLRSIVGKTITPASAGGSPIDAWAIFPVDWDLSGKKMNAPDRPNAAIAHLEVNQSLPVKASDYPKGSLERREQGNSFVHIAISDTGAVLDTEIRKGSGASDLDNAALAAIRAARFSPAFSDHKPVNSSTDIVVSWILPATSAPVPSSERP